ncbi:MAG: response regulator transcription factor [Candidatus Sumerlaeaceae bacterium]
MILVVDDDVCIARAIADVLRLNGFSVSTAASCDEALSCIEENPPSLVLCDINMPDHSGLELLQVLKENSETQAIPLVFVSAMGRAQDVENGLKAGAAGYLVKPFDPAKLLNTVRELALTA